MSTFLYVLLGLFFVTVLVKNETEITRKCMKNLQYIHWLKNGQIKNFDQFIKVNFDKENRFQLNFIEVVACLHNLKTKIDTFKHNQHDPDFYRTSDELIKSRGFKCETHYVTTEDGFVLTLFRIPSIHSQKAKPVFLLHGFLSSSDCYLNNNRKESLAYILADHGYDVWLGNVRGNRYSEKHINLTKFDPKFWEWSFDEMAKFDIQAMVEYVTFQTKFSTISFIGHSQGTTTFIASTILGNSNLSHKIDKFIALAPAIFLSHCQSLIRYFVEFSRIIKVIWDVTEHGDFFSHEKLGKLAEIFCPEHITICKYILVALCGGPESHLNNTRIPVYLSHAPAGSSTQNMEHWAQQIENKNDTFLYYDYGSNKANFNHYGSFTVPQYNLSEMIVPTYIFYGGNDWLVDSIDANNLIKALPNVKYTKFLWDYNHLDFVWAYDANSLVYKYILNILVD